jgi:hypothetical protein
VEHTITRRMTRTAHRRPNRFAAAIAEIDRDLERRAEEIVRTRERIAQLRGRPHYQQTDQTHHCANHHAELVHAQ